MLLLNSSVTQSCRTCCNPIDWSTPDFLIHYQLRELTQTHVPRVGDTIQPSSRWYHPTISSSPAPFSSPFNLSQHQGPFKWVSSSHQYWSFSFSISPSNEYSGLIFFRIDWCDLEVQGILKSLLQYHSSKVSVLWHSFSLLSNSHIYTWLLEKL